VRHVRPANRLVLASPSVSTIISTDKRAVRDRAGRRQSEALSQP
jgi:hypothetical protein